MENKATGGSKRHLGLVLGTEARGGVGGGLCTEGFSPYQPLAPWHARPRKHTEGTGLFRPTHRSATWMARLLGLGRRMVPQGKLKGAEPHQRKALSSRSPPFAPWTNAPLDVVCGVEDERERLATRRREPPQSPAVCRRTTLPLTSRALAPPCRALVRAAGRAGPGGAGPGAGPGPGTVALAWQGGLQPRGPCTAWGGAAGRGAPWPPRVWVPRSYSWAPRPAP